MGGNGCSELVARRNSGGIEIVVQRERDREGQIRESESETVAFGLVGKRRRIRGFGGRGGEGSCASERREKSTYGNFCVTTQMHSASLHSENYRY